MAINVNIFNGMTNAEDEDVNSAQSTFLYKAGVVNTSKYNSDLSSPTYPSFKGLASGTPDTNTNVNRGVAFIPDNTTNPNQYYRIDMDAEEVVAHDATTSNPRIDAVVLFLDIAASSDADASNVASIEVVKGAEAASPTAPSDADITTALGDDTWIRLYDTNIANPLVSISSGDITDQREAARVNGGYIVLPNDIELYFEDSSGNKDSYIQQSASDDLEYVLGTASKVHKLKDSTGSDVFIVHTGDNYSGTRNGKTIRAYDSANTDYVEIEHNGSNSVVSTNVGGVLMKPAGGFIDVYDSTGTDAARVQHNGTYAIFRSIVGDAYLQPASGSNAVINMQANGDVMVIAKMPVRSHSTSNYVSSHIQRGWTYIQGSGSYTTSGTVTIPVPYSSSGIDIQVSSIGVKNGVPSSRTDVSAAASVCVNVYNITSSSFDIYFYPNNAASTSSSSFYWVFSWIAIGPV